MEWQKSSWYATMLEGGSVLPSKLDALGDVSDEYYGGRAQTVLH